MGMVRMGLCVLIFVAIIFRTNFEVKTVNTAIKVNYARKFLQSLVKCFKISDTCSQNYSSLELKHFDREYCDVEVLLLTGPILRQAIFARPTIAENELRRDYPLLRLPLSTSIVFFSHSP
jgi:hypothetical protein